MLVVEGVVKAAIGVEEVTNLNIEKQFTFSEMRHLQSLDKQQVD